MLTKEQFVSTLDLIKKHTNLSTKLSDILEEMSPGCRCDTFLYSEYEILTIQLLKAALNLPKDNDDIEYFMYDLEFGTKYTPGCYTFKDGTKIDFSSAEAVYDYLVTYKTAEAPNVT